MRAIIRVVIFFIMRDSDECILAEVRRQLSEDARVDESRLAVSVSNGIVEIKGTVAAYLSKAAAYYDARSVDGVRAINDCIRVSSSPASEKPSEDELVLAVRRAFLSNEKLRNQQINVQVEGSTVKLSGKVDEAWKIMLAGELAFFCGGVRRVENSLEVP